MQPYRGVFVLLWSLGLCCGLNLSAAHGQTTNAVVTGADRVFVRRGAGTEFPPFATLTSGSTVEVQEMKGDWARIVTANGQVGYVNSTFLVLSGERERPAITTAVEAPRPTPAAPTPQRGETATLRALSERNKTLEAELRGVRDEMATLKSRPEVTPVCPVLPTPAAVPASAGVEQLRGELARLTAAVDGVQRRLETHGAAAPAEFPAPAATTTAPSAATEGTPHGVSPTAVLLGTCGLVLGWLMGSAYARSQERGRRSRIRF